MIEVFSGTLEEDHPELFKVEEIKEQDFKIIEEDIYMLEFMNDYKPEKVTDGYAVIKGLGNANFNYARIENYAGDNPEYTGHRMIKYELQICDGQDNAGRRFWKSIDLQDENKVKKFADVIWTVTALTFKKEEELQAALETMANLTVEVRYWGFVTEQEKKLAVEEGREPEKIQTHLIKGQAKAKGETKKSDVPF